MRCKTILVALLALAFQAQAAHVSESDAAGAASVWAGAGKALGKRLGARVESVSEHAVTNGYSFYAVKLDGGTVIMSSDTDIEPVIAFSSSGDIDLSEGSLALDLLRKDIALRAALVGGAVGGASGSSRRTTAASAASTSAASTSAAATVPRPGASLWGSLLSASQQASSTTPSRRLSASSARPVSSVSDVRVAPFVLSKWSQSTVDDKKTGALCYNYYTPNNYVCGCTATAMSQIMRYFEFPTAEVEPQEFDCKVNSQTETLVMQGGVYDWASMTLVPKDGISDEGCEAIGKLTSDTGIALKSDYSASVTGADPQAVPAALRDAFGYADAICYFNEGALEGKEVGLHKRDLRTRTILANLDVGQPVLLAIYGYGSGGGWAGHAVVADGYGYQNVDGVETEFVHINMGWSGKDDMWYNIPEIDAANTGAQASDSGYTFKYLGGAIFNISTEDTGLSILSGRTIDADGVAVPGARVDAYDADGYWMGEAVSDENGIYYFKLAGDEEYYLEAISPDGRCIADNVVNLPATKNLDDSYCVALDDDVGNSWGNDMELAPPSVRVGDFVYSSLDKAIAVARETAVPGTAQLVEILETTRLKVTSTIDFDCIIVATNADPFASAVLRRAGAMLSVAPDATLSISNVVFSSGSTTLVDVSSGGTLALAGTVDFGVPYNVPAVTTVTAEGLLVCGGVERGFTLDCAEATNEGDTFGYAYAKDVAMFDAIRASASHIANYYDETGEVRGHMTGSSPYYPLVWRRQTVPVEDCVGYFVDADGKTNTAGRVDKLFDLYSQALADGRIGDERRIVILESDSLSRPLVVAADTSIVGDGVDIALDSSAGFTVTGGELSVSGMAFSGYVGNALFMVNGDDASLALGPGVAFSDIEGTNRWSGAVTVLKGSASATGATFTNCCATGKYSPTRFCNSNGGAFYLAEGTSLALEDVSITGCNAHNLGGAVYAAKGATVSLAGNMNISGNTVPKWDDDIYLVNSSGNRATLTLSGVVTGSVGVRMSGPADGYGNESGLLVAAAADAAIAHASAAAFFCDVNADVVAEPDDAAVALRWTDAPKGPQPWEGDPDEASARVEYKDGTEAYYLLVSEALAAVSDDATIYVQGWNGIDFAEDVVISHKITIASDLDVGFFWLYRAGDCSIKVVEGASLTLRDISVFGVPVDDYGDPTYDEEFVLLMSKPLFEVCGGSLTLASPSDDIQYYTEIAFAIAGGVYTNPRTGRVYYLGARNASAVCVWNGGAFRMEEGACIHDCANLCYDMSDGTGRGGAVLVDDGEAVFAGGTIYNCMAESGGGVFVGNKGAVSVSGETWIVDNYTLGFARDFLDELYIVQGDDNNLVVHDLGKLTLAGKMTGLICYTEGLSGDKVVFGKVAPGVSAADAQSSAHNFEHDVTGDVGMAVSGPEGMLLVWSDGVAANGVYTDDDGNEYSLAQGEPVEIYEPEAVFALVYNGEVQVGVEPGIGYTVVGNEATGAGEYAATVTPKAGFQWFDGSTAAKTVDWAIAKAEYDMSGVSFDDMTVVYGGQDFTLEISGELPDGVRVSYENNRHSEAGVYEAVASFSGDADNYEPIDDMFATLTIVAVDEPTPPSGEDPAQPLPVAFSAISEDDGTWTLAVTTTVEKCWYSLYETDDIDDGFDVGDLLPVEVRKATADDVPTMTFTRPSDGGQLFWKVVAEPEDAR